MDAGFCDDSMEMGVEIVTLDVEGDFITYRALMSQGLMRVDEGVAEVL